VYLNNQQLLYQGLRNPLRSLPGPWHSRFTRLPLKLAIVTGRRAFYVHDLHTKYGGVVRISPNEVAVSDPEGLATIHRIGSGFRKTNWYREFTAQPDRFTAFTMIDPKQHAARRKLFARPFSRTFLLQHWHDTVRDMTRFAVRRMKETAAGSEGKLDVLLWWNLMTMDVSGRLMYGHDFDNMSRGTVSLSSGCAFQRRLILIMLL
jgi:cytochrome P450